jgi:hypothetical protein
MRVWIITCSPRQATDYKEEKIDGAKKIRYTMTETFPSSPVFAVRNP